MLDGASGGAPVDTASSVAISGGLTLHFADGYYTAWSDSYEWLTAYAGDPAEFPTSVTMPDDSPLHPPYAGDPDSFPTGVRLVDDGDVP